MNLLLFIIFFIRLISSQNFKPSFKFDLPLINANSSIINEMNQIYKNAKVNILGNPKKSLNSALESYFSLNISVVNDTISGINITSFLTVNFIGEFVKYLNANNNQKNNTLIRYIENTIWLVCENIIKKTLKFDYFGYEIVTFMREGVFTLEYISDKAKDQLFYIFEYSSENWEILWESKYDSDYQQNNKCIYSDYILNFADSLLLFFKYFKDYDSQYRYILTVRRFLIRYLSVYTNGLQDGTKIDGSGYHHRNNYEAYMNSYQTAILVLNMWKKTSFQISEKEYLIFRNSIMHKILISTDSNIIPLPMTGRTGIPTTTFFYKESFFDLSILGGEILKLNSADPILAGVYNRIYGVRNEFNYTKIHPFDTGFYQNNHFTAGIYRNRNYVVSIKGFTSILWGSEIYEKSNRYGRYQSYGAMSIFYPGSFQKNGVNFSSYNWNYNPGTTTKVLPYNKLIAGYNTIMELQEKNFTGALQFELKKAGYLNEVYGKYGMFAMDFKEKKQRGWLGKTGEDTHDSTFTFKKSYFCFDNYIICLGSNISNEDKVNPTVTTLYQNIEMRGKIWNEDKNFTQIGNNTFFLSNNSTMTMIIDNLGTGFIILPGSGDVILNNTAQQTPSNNQTNPNILNKQIRADIGYINHGNSPNNSEYEYLVVPNTNISEMLFIKSSLLKKKDSLYKVIQKDKYAHIVYHNKTNIYALALFNLTNIINQKLIINKTDYPCMIIYKVYDNNTKLMMSIVNPNLELTKDRMPFGFKVITVELNGKWIINDKQSSIKFKNYLNNNSVYEFNTTQALPIEVYFSL